MNHTKSKAWFSEAKNYIPGGVDSPVRSFANVHQTPLFINHAKGSKIYDVDDNEYIDYIGSWGPMILGHAHPILCENMEEVVQKGISYGLCAPQEVELAKLICKNYPSMDMVRFVNSGTEATMSAIRVARGFTKRDKIIKFEGCYHGHSDGLLVKSGSGALTFGIPTSPGVPQDIVKNTIVCEYNSLASVERAIEHNQDEIAAIILEPVAANMGVILSQLDFLQGLRKLCDKFGIVLIFDEVISGFRLGISGAAGVYGVTPDMACFGKIIGAGMPVGAYGGKQELMEMVSPQGMIYQAGTLSGNPLAMELGTRLLTHLEKHPTLFEELEKKGKYLKTGVQSILDELKLPYQIHQVGSLFTLFFCDHPIVRYQDVKDCDNEAYAIYFKSLLDQSILIAPSPYEAMFLSLAHSQEDLDKTIQAMKIALSEVQTYVLSR